MNTDQINYVNIGLMILSCILAFLVPFELFLFSYAVLGPLHYLTEVSWLHKRQCFSPGKKDFIILALMALAITLPNILPYFYSMWGPKDMDGHMVLTEDLISLFTTMGSGVPGIVFIAFAGSALLILAKDTMRRVIGFVVIIFIGYVVHTEKIMFIAFAVLLPTLVHVFVFTGAFILVGALKSKSTSGVLSLVVFAGCALSLFLLFPNTITAPTPYGEKTYDAAFFQYSQQLFDAFFHKQATKELVYHSGTGIMLARFVAFAYTYHYLNWFSKTSVIKWHLLPRRSLVTIIVLWVLSLALYLTDYRTGLMALFFLSYLHVVFEFPLNFRSFKDIGTEMMARIRPVKS